MIQDEEADETAAEQLIASTDENSVNEPPLASVYELVCVHQHKATLIACLAVTAIVWTANSIIVTFFPQEATGQGITESTIGVLFAAAPLSNFLSAPVAGWLNGDHLCGRKGVLFSGLSLFMVTNVAMGFAVNIAEWLASESDDKTGIVTAAFLACRILQGTPPRDRAPQCV